ncbi:hypothetical protein CDL12_24333 [Handroanthus impetiginosus]|uniref:Uncharacterized protein n=1 Tax=Handroanthus impetiginosus TaxID=429701 RepID=A0A2G9GD75_9LAMI|nr:hypothetical protein CDL12_24333 [Handroanthus impetiginosus]
MINLSSAVRFTQRIFLMLFSKCLPRPFLRHVRHHFILVDTDEADTESTTVGTVRESFGREQGEETPK